MNSYFSALTYDPRPDDIFLVTYPKSGTTWTQHILMLIFSHGEPIKSAIHFFGATPFLEMTGAEGADKMPRPGVIKTHFPFHLTPWSDQAKYIHVARNPKDCCVSFYHHQKNAPESFDGDFDEFFELFLAGRTNFGDYFDHLLSWYAHRNDENVFFMTYEKMKEHPEDSVLKMASFLDDELYAKPLRSDSSKLENVIRYSSLEYMKQIADKLVDDVLEMPTEDILNSDLPHSMTKMFIRFQKLKMSGHAEKTNSAFLRKGIIGDWKNHLSKEQSERLDKKFAERTRGSDLASLWLKYM